MALQCPGCPAGHGSPAHSSSLLVARWHLGSEAPASLAALVSLPMLQGTRGPGRHGGLLSPLT